MTADDAQVVRLSALTTSSEAGVPGIPWSGIISSRPPAPARACHVSGRVTAAL
jgi:hypothetical protein